jgi:uncharacterized membrane protein YhaH (DUF805 family)
MDGAFSVDGARRGGSGGRSETLSPWGYYKKVWSQYADFSGRARRREYWWFYLFNFLGALLLMIPATMMDPASGSSLPFLLVIPLVLYAVAVIIPYLAVTVRRLHDSGRSGWWFVLLQLVFAFIPFLNLIGGVVMLAFLVTDSEDGPNQYGPNPKAVVNVYEFSEIFS